MATTCTSTHDGTEGRCCQIFDCVLHNDVIDDCNASSQMRDFIARLAVENIENKHSITLERRKDANNVVVVVDS